MRDYDDKGRSVENVKNEHYVAMPNSWEARNNRETNVAMGYNNMTDLTNTAHPATSMQGAKRNVQLSPDISRLNNYNYNKKR
jgi:hypothetical protein